ncbi:solute carrier organic anion transporter family member 1C1-like [Ambystoma mexicanum]|uniref:solute carrier organic anion transporter family member 1C1-like n=1 Tax=Ambystoma mexicanum TaxID=8296 RepID=UPI0037E79230
MTVERDSNNGSEPVLNSPLKLDNEAADQVKKKPSCFASLKVFLIALSFAYFAKALSGSYMKSSITQIERRFDITSSVVGLVDGSFEIGNLLVIAFVSYFGANCHRPKIIAAGCFLMTIGSFITAMPHFFMGHYKYETSMTHETATSNTSSNISPCLANSYQSPAADASETIEITMADCEKESGTYMWIYVLLGNLLRGIGETPITPLGLSYLDDYSKYENTPFYIACVHTISIFGPVAGFMLGSLCARLYVDIGFVNLESVTITPEDTRWVGAWWLGFLLSAAVSLLAAIPFLFLPRSLVKQGHASRIKCQEEMPPSKEEENKTPKSENVQLKELTNIKGFVRSTKRLISNRLYMLFICLMLLQFSSFIGFITYKPKFMEQQYGQSISRANFITGVTTLPAVALGMFLGGLFMKKFKLGLVGTAKLAFGTSFTAFLLSLLVFILGCQNNDVAGITVSYDGSQLETFKERSFYSPCNSDCRCSSNQWDPVCGDNGITYMSACLAGCKSSIGTGRNIGYGNCSCIEALSPNSGNFSVVLGQCPRGDDCSRMFLYYVISQVIAAFVYSLGGAASFIIMFRCVDPELKSLAIGIYTLVMRTLAGIPAPIYFGALIDRSCLKWGTKRCGGRGACRIYDSALYRNTFVGLTAGLRAPSYLLCIVFIFMAKKHHPKGDAEVAENTEKGDVFMKEDITLKSSECSGVPEKLKETHI